MNKLRLCILQTKLILLHIGLKQMHVLLLSKFLLYLAEWHYVNRPKLAYTVLELIKYLGNFQNEVMLMKKIHNSIMILIYKMNK